MFCKKGHTYYFLENVISRSVTEMQCVLFMIILLQLHTYNNWIWTYVELKRLNAVREHLFSDIRYILDDIIKDALIIPWICIKG